MSITIWRSNALKSEAVTFHGFFKRTNLAMVLKLPIIYPYTESVKGLDQNEISAFLRSFMCIACVLTGTMGILFCPLPQLYWCTDRIRSTHAKTFFLS